MSANIDKILELLDNPTQRTTEFAPGDANSLLSTFSAAASDAVAGMQPLLDALRAAGISMADFLAARRRRVPMPYKRNKHFGYGR